MNKAVGAILCIILVASPLLLLFSADIQEEGQVPWQLHYRGVLDYARRYISTPAQAAPEFLILESYSQYGHGSK